MQFISKLWWLLFAIPTLAVAAEGNDSEKVEPGFNEQTFKGLELRSIGPAFMSGRIADIAISGSMRPDFLELSLKWR